MPILETRPLGRTGHASSVAVLGGAAFWTATSDDVAAAFDLAMQYEVNHLDIAPRYGAAEEAVGPVLAGVRDKWFVGCKTAETTRDDTRAQLERSLTRLHCERFDLYQLHAVTSVEELDRRSGAMAAVLAARDEGLTRFVGVTGHDLGAPAAHLEAIRRYDVDTVMFPIYPRVWADDQYRADAEALLAECQRRGVGVLVIKAAARRPWGDKDRDAGTWYEPWRDADKVARGVRFALSTPGVTGFCTPGDLDVLRVALPAAADYRPMSEAERQAAMADTAEDELIFPLAAKSKR